MSRRYPKPGRSTQETRPIEVTIVCSNRGRDDPPKVLGKVGMMTGAEDWQAVVENYTVPAGMVDNTLRSAPDDLHQTDRWR